MYDGQDRNSDPPSKRYRRDESADPTNPNPSIVVHVRNLSAKVIKQIIDNGLIDTTRKHDTNKHMNAKTRANRAFSCEGAWVVVDSEIVPAGRQPVSHAGWVWYPLYSSYSPLTRFRCGPLLLVNLLCFYSMCLAYQEGGYGGYSRDDYGYHNSYGHGVHSQSFGSGGQVVIFKYLICNKILFGLQFF
uniref:HTH_48 domain-containing protein n=1 Tax=Heterorhabditis bacteriophora TaxID=37862 RepID=A0A1I7WU33_HETBA